MTKEEAIEVYHGLINPKIKEAFEFFVPELRENEDERIIQFFAELATDACGGPGQEYYKELGLNYDKVMAWLEKQKDIWKERAQNITANMLEDKIEGIQRELIEFLSNTVNASWVDIMQSADDYAERIRNIIEKQKEQKPILEVFGFKVGDAVRLKDGDGRKHIIKSFEEVEGVHGPNFYHVEFEDDSARDGIYPGEEYPNGYYTQMEKFEEEQKPVWSEEDKKMIDHLIEAMPMWAAGQITMLPSQAEEYVKRLKSLCPQPHTVSMKDATKFGNLEYERGVKDGIQHAKNHQWKPSEEQLIALRYYLNHVPYSLHKEHLSSLRDDCEKLFIQ